MPKKFQGENTKSAAARARRAEAKAAADARKQKELEDAYWKDEDKHVMRKEQRKVGGSQAPAAAGKVGSQHGNEVEGGRRPLGLWLESEKVLDVDQGRGGRWRQRAGGGGGSLGKAATTLCGLLSLLRVMSGLGQTGASQPRAVLHPAGTWQHPETFWGVTAGGWKGPLASGGRGPGSLLNTLQGPGTVPP